MPHAGEVGNANSIYDLQMHNDVGADGARAPLLQIVQINIAASSATWMISDQVF